MAEHVNLNVSVCAYSPQKCIKCIFGIFDVCKCLRSQHTCSGKEESTLSVIDCIFVLFTFVNM